MSLMAWEHPEEFAQPLHHWQLKHSITKFYNLNCIYARNQERYSREVVEEHAFPYSHEYLTYLHFFVGIGNQYTDAIGCSDPYVCAHEYFEKEIGELPEDEDEEEGELNVIFRKYGVPKRSLIFM